MEDSSSNSVAATTRSSGFGSMASNVPPPGQVVPAVGAMPTIPVPTVQTISDVEQSQPTLPTTVPPISSNVAQPVPPVGVAQGNGNGFSNGATHPSQVISTTSSSKPEYAAIPPPAVVTLSSSSAGQVVAISDEQKEAEEEAEKAKQEELQKKLMVGQEPATIAQQENMQIKGQSARHLVMQKVMLGY